MAELDNLLQYLRSSGIFSGQDQQDQPTQPRGAYDSSKYDVPMQTNSAAMSPNANAPALQFPQSQGQINPQAVQPAPVMNAPAQGQSMGQSTPFDTPPDISQTSINSSDPMDRMRQLYTPEHAAIDKMNEMINNMPQRNKPGIGRKILAVIAGAGTGDVRNGEEALYAPYNNQMQDWHAKFDPLEKMATQERGANANERGFAQSVMQNELGQQKEKDTQTKNDTTARQKDEQIAISKQRADTNEYYRTHPNHVYKVDDKRRLIAINPVTNKSEFVLDSDGNPVTSDKLTEEQKINMEIQGRKDVAAIPRTVNTSSSTSTITPPDSEQPTQQKQRMINNAQKLINEHPEFAKAVQFDPDTKLPVVAPEGTTISGGWFGFGGTKLTKEDIKQINDSINTAKPLSAARTTTTNRTSTSSQAAPNNSPKKGDKVGSAVVRVRDPKTGQTGAFQGTADEAHKAGYDVIQGN